MVRVGRRSPDLPSARFSEWGTELLHEGVASQTPPTPRRSCRSTGPTAQDNLADLACLWGQRLVGGDLSLTKGVLYQLSDVITLGHTLPMHLLHCRRTSKTPSHGTWHDPPGGRWVSLDRVGANNFLVSVPLPTHRCSDFRQLANGGPPPSLHWRALIAPSPPLRRWWRSARSLWSMSPPLSTLKTRAARLFTQPTGDQLHRHLTLDHTTLSPGAGGRRCRRPHGCPQRRTRASHRGADQ